MAAAKQYPDVIIPYGYLDVDHPDARAQLETFAKAGVKGIKMHRPKLNWDDFGYFPLYGRMQELGLVALFHTGIVAGNGTGEPEQSSMARMRPSFLHTLARSFPTLKIQGAHLGNPWYDEAAEAARWSPNLYFDVTGSTLLKKQHNLKVFREYLWWDGPSTHTPSTAVYAFEKIVFGTDEPPDALDGVLARYEAMLDANDGAGGESPQDLRRDDGAVAGHHAAALNAGTVAALDRAMESAALAEIARPHAGHGSRAIPERIRARSFWMDVGWGGVHSRLEVANDPPGSSRHRRRAPARRHDRRPLRASGEVLVDGAATRHHQAPRRVHHQHLGAGREERATDGHR